MYTLYIKNFLTLHLDPKMETQCVSFTLPQQFAPKYKSNSENSEEDLLRTCKYFLLPLCLGLCKTVFIMSLSSLSDTRPGG